MIQLKRTGVLIKPDPRRVLFRPFQIIDKERIFKIFARVLSLTEEKVNSELENVKKESIGRHSKLLDLFLNRFDQFKDYVYTNDEISINRKQLLGAYFSSEYSFESAALFNPSMIWHPDQTGTEKGSKRFILSLRATGEGHISSITFRSGIITEDYSIKIDDPSPYVTLPEEIQNPVYNKYIFQNKLFDTDISNEFVEQIMSSLQSSFTFNELEEILKTESKKKTLDTVRRVLWIKNIRAIAQSNYEVIFSKEDDISKRVIFPTSPSESNGMEDVRFVEFEHDDGLKTFYGTYTAYDGKMIYPQLLETKDFLHFSIKILTGDAVQNKGFALFPKKINGKYAMLSRQDNENLYIMFSDNFYFWQTKQLIARPSYPWEYVQIGNCGSPIETKEGWIVLTHGVGPMRKYCISALLLDKDDPTKIIGRLKEPLISPNEDEREGYVPNVVYSCGGQILNDQLIIPYAMSDSASTFALVNLNELLTELKKK
ncbi:MAG: glycoside hydrolase family 130 protein [Ignavibacteriales bacterium]|nr:glycoside hydrolase family 130 protein [Ignavibacteriales bacterium]